MVLAKEIVVETDLATIAAGVFPPYLLAAAVLIAVFLWFRRVGFSARTLFVLLLSLAVDTVLLSASANNLASLNGPIFLFIVLPLGGLMIPLLTLVGIDKALNLARAYSLQRLPN